MLEVDPCLQNADILCLHSKCIGSVDVGSCTTMPPTVAVPVCPPHTPCGLERLFFQQGWIWNDDVLTEVLGWLHRQGIEDGYDLVGTSRAEDIPGAERFPCDVLQFISKAAMARVCVILLPRSCYISCVSQAAETFENESVAVVPAPKVAR